MKYMEDKKFCCPTQTERLGQFAAAHFVISLAGALAAMAIGLILVEVIGDFDVLLTLIAVAAVILILAYGAAGARAARVCGWEKPKGVASAVLAFLFPALIAWGWGSLVLCCSYFSGRGWAGAATALLMVSFFAAFPSFLAVLASHLLGFLDGGLLSMVLCMLLVGGLPPLLFLLGSILGGRKAACPAEQVREEKEVRDETE